jgi:hypothetical protein
MDTYQTILLALGEIKGDLGEIKGELAGMRTMVERVRRLEMWQSWLKGGWAFLASAFIWKTTFKL